MQIGLTGILTIIFVVAKLAGWIDWSWWLVLSPTLAGLALAVVIMVAGFGLAFLTTTPKRRIR